MQTTLTRALAVALALAAPLRADAQPAASPPAGTQYVIIVNATNPIPLLTHEDAMNIFLKRVIRWDNEEPIVVVDQSAASTTRRAFSRDILRKEVTAVKSYWQQLVFSGRATPPVEKRTDGDVVAFVARNGTAIGYVAPGAALDSRVRVVRLVP
jgi:ABC-type phosphate transport system substrate-binding protein